MSIFPAMNNLIHPW